MHFHLALALLSASSAAASFVPSYRLPRCPFSLQSTVQDRPQVQESTKEVDDETPLFGEEINIRLEAQMEKLRAKDQKSRALTKEELDILYEDEHIVVINKPTGILSVPTKDVQACISQSVFEAFGCEMNRADMMVVHRLAMDSSGIMVLVKTKKALRGMNTNFRTRHVLREYEVLVCGHVQDDYGVINLPIMRDYERPPYMRISTLQHQYKLIDLDPDIVGKKILEAPKECITKYQVIAREELGGQPVTRLLINSVSGRTHQLNVHLAAIGHPIVGDKTYGFGGDALPNGGLTEAEMKELAPNPNRPSQEVLKKIAIQGKPTCVHASSMNFRHPVTKRDVTFDCDAPF